MSRHPRLSAAAEALPASLFARLYERLARFQGDVIPLQIGDTYLPPAVRLPDLDLGIDRELYPYAPPQGWAPLVDRLVDKVRTRNQIPVTHDGVQVTCGATHALACAVGALLDPGEEIILLTPHWPLIRGIAQSRSVVPVEVPFTLPLLGGDDAAEVLRHVIRPQTAAIYLCTPNNPDGLVLDDHTLGVIAEVAQRHDLWVLADEAYEDYVYQGQHRSIASLPGMAERTVTVYSFSKSYAQAGLRVGYAVGPSQAMAAVRKMANHSVYNVPQAMQKAALGSLERGAPFLADARVRYQAARDRAHATVAAPALLPQGSTYLFLDLSAWCPEPDCAMGVLENIAEAGVLLAPGAPFGEVYGKWARLCFTAVDQARLDEGIGRINRVLDGLPRTE
ncbi:MAG: pyridoxal phosphate-dependent aminotransferase [Kofleriaceae bacterium]|nr:pyridoxal phosphate-dependent aminotransferase [Myxococcales bacterium]MCB9564352.1 pyridoxal phosphate-dependent aminotransferase [Kofleriaceae bacterium]